MYEVLEEKIVCPKSQVIRKEDSTSSKYKFASTQNIINIFEKQGFEVTDYQKASVRKKNSRRAGFQPHLIRMSRPDLRIDDGNRVELLISNSHDGSRSLKIMLGIFRFVCANGMIAGEQFFSHRVKHIGQDFEENLNIGIAAALDKVEELKDTVVKMRRKILSPEEIKELALSVATKRLQADPERIRDIDLDNMLDPQREEDKGNDLYTVMNVLQEKCIRGGIDYELRTDKKDENGKVISFSNKWKSTKPTKGLDTMEKFNKMVFDECLKMVA